jgi:cardiolipin synthase
MKPVDSSTAKVGGMTCLRAPTTVRRSPWIVRLVIIGVGCQALAACYAATDAPPPPRPCLLLARQLVQDSAAALACHPLRTTFHIAADSTHKLCALTRGALGKRIAMHFMAQPDGETNCGEPAWCEELDDASPQEFEPAQLELQVDGRQALAALERVIAQANCRIDVLMYQWENDPVGAALADQLAAKAAQGVRVRILVDGAGNLFFGHPCRGKDNDVNRVVSELARRPGVELIRTANPFACFDHRKLVIVDGRLVWTGGRNLTSPCFREIHDLSLVVQGPLVTQLESCFESFWCAQGGAPLALQAYSDFETGSPQIPLEVNAVARLIRTEPCQHEIESTLYRVVGGAQHYLYLENFTFSDSRLLVKLACARRRGVDVRVVLTLSCCCQSVNRTNRVTANRLLAAGVRVYVHPAMTHVKAATADGCWAYVGSANFDTLSLRHNREIGLSIVAGPVIGELEDRLFQPDLRPEWELKERLSTSPRDYLSELASSLFL